MFRWPLELTGLSLRSGGVPRAAILEVTPRGALFMLASLSHVGHPAHLAVADAYVKGQVRLTPTADIGEDTRLVVSALAAPLLVAHELGIERLSLADLTLLPRPLARDADEPVLLAAWNVRSPDSVRFLLPRVAPTRRLGPTWAWVRAAERFEPAGCLGTPRPGQTSPWHDVFVQLGVHSPADPISAEVREPTTWANVFPLLEAGLVNLGLARFARARGLQQAVGLEVAQLTGRRSCANMPSAPISPADVRAEIAGVSSGNHAVRPLDSMDGLHADVVVAATARTPAEWSAPWNGFRVHISLVQELDGYQTLCLVPLRSDPLVPPTVQAVFEAMRDLTWEVIEALIGRPLPERRTEPIALRLLAADGRVTTLDVGVSVVIGRNQQVFAAWVGSDGRVMLRLFPPGGMPVNQA